MALPCRSLHESCMASPSSVGSNQGWRAELKIKSGSGSRAEGALHNKRKSPKRAVWEMLAFCAKPLKGMPHNHRRSRISKKHVKFVFLPNELYDSRHATSTT